MRNTGISKKKPRTAPFKNNSSLSGFQMLVLSSVPKISDIKSPNPSKAGIFPNVCLFPSKARKIIKSIKQKLVNVEIQNFEKSFKMHMQWMGDANLSVRLSGEEFAVKKVKYHSYCPIKHKIEVEEKHN